MICGKCLEKNPARRYASMDALAADLLGTGSPMSRSTLDRRCCWSVCRSGPGRHPVKTVAGSVALAAFAVIAVLLVKYVQTSKDLAREKESLEQANESLDEQATRMAGLAASEREAAERAEEQARIATERADEVLSLSALQNLEELRNEADELWPPHPMEIWAYEHWLVDAEEVIGRLDDFYDQLKRLEAMGEPKDFKALWRGRRDDPAFPEYERAKARLEALRRRRTVHSARRGIPPEGLEAELEQVEGEVEKLKVQIDRRVGPWFDHDQDRWWYDQLVELVNQLEAFVDPRTGLAGDDPAAVSETQGWSIPRRLAFAQRLEDGIAEGGVWRERWKSAIAAIQADDGYEGMRLAPQTGLVPMGPDPVSGLWEFWHVATGTEPQRGHDGKLVLSEDMGLVLVLIPGGTFWMGAQATDPDRPNYDPGASSRDGPVHQAWLPAYFLSKYEMTQEQWRRGMGWNPSTERPRGGSSTARRNEASISGQDGGIGRMLVRRLGARQVGDHPVESVSWNDCVEWLPRLGLTLPSEAQWEYGCRAGSDTVWWPGSDRAALEGVANLNDRFAQDRGVPGWSDHETWLNDGALVHAPIGTYRANAFGLHEVHGNVWEWCLDVFDPSSPNLGHPRPDLEEQVKAAEGAVYRASRGGSYGDSAREARSANRGFFTPSSALGHLGVRPARDVEPW